eukprot:CAMPEP_0113626892 /NCGR_PEP_ID=MMETSP0017_2-20120614/13917_1 /TAXON_ID=2856 /ORGANISM="Cylindrotheca closterium" /LENGTH=324 /DNA_ID=CAMNT_0000537107 /DNA_START=312 /DNA_END=1286 /DNA_ORIENTATION=- /assembly_acc=CAM_ASM_000147
MDSALAQEAMEKESLGESFDEGSSGSFTSWEDSDDESLIEEMGERLEEFSHIGTTPALAALIFNTDDYKLALPRKRFPKASDSSVTSLQNSILSDIVFTKSDEDSIKSFQIRRSNSDQFIQQGSYTNLATPAANATFNNDKSKTATTKDTKPFSFLKEILKQDGISYPSVSEEATKSLLLEMKHENYEAYGREIADAARNGNIEGVKSHIDSGKTLQCCNKFQESILHLVCRRGHEDILKLMLEETDVSVCIQDDLGRTPLHELAWTSIPNFAMVKLILQKSPDLLYVKDNRQFTPLHYVGKNNWDAWCEFLGANRDLLATRVF